MFTVRKVYSTSRGNGSSSISVSPSAGTTENPERTHTFGNRAGNAAKHTAQILDDADKIVKTESFSEAGVTNVSLGSDYLVDNQNVTGELQTLQNEWQAGVGEKARGDLSPEEFSNLSQEKQSMRINLAIATSAASPISQVEQKIQDAGEESVVSETIVEEPVIRPTSY